MKYLLEAAIIIGFLVFITCKPCQKQKEEKAKQDSIAKVDSISKKFVGEWSVDGQYHSFIITKKNQTIIVKERDSSTMGISFGYRTRIYFATIVQGKLKIDTYKGAMYCSYLPQRDHILVNGHECIRKNLKKIKMETRNHKKRGVTEKPNE
jgi:hypothetical protein